jgi:hypothetical protein
LTLAVVDCAIHGRVISNKPAIAIVDTKFGGVKFTFCSEECRKTWEERKNECLERRRDCE